MDLKKLLKPETVAIVGASEKAGFGGDTTRNYLKFSKNLDKLYLVNPGRDSIFRAEILPFPDRYQRGCGFSYFMHASENHTSLIKRSGREKLRRGSSLCQRLR